MRERLVEVAGARDVEAGALDLHQPEAAQGTECQLTRTRAHPRPHRVERDAPRCERLRLRLPFDALHVRGPRRRVREVIADNDERLGRARAPREAVREQERLLVCLALVPAARRRLHARDEGADGRAVVREVHVPRRVWRRVVVRLRDDSHAHRDAHAREVDEEVLAQALELAAHLEDARAHRASHVEGDGKVELRDARSGGAPAAGSSDGRCGRVCGRRRSRISGCRRGRVYGRWRSRSCGNDGVSSWRSRCRLGRWIAPAFSRSCKCWLCSRRKGARGGCEGVDLRQWLPSARTRTSQTHPFQP